MTDRLPKRISEKRFNELISELIDDRCSCDYCFLKVFVESLHPEPIVLVQLKCIEMFKWDESKRVGSDVGWNDAGMRWAMNGYATAFRKVYDENLTIREIYKRTVLEVEKI